MGNPVEDGIGDFRTLGLEDPFKQGTKEIIEFFRIDQSYVEQSQIGIIPAGRLITNWLIMPGPIDTGYQGSGDTIEARFQPDFNGFPFLSPFALPQIGPNKNIGVSFRNNPVRESVPGDILVDFLFDILTFHFTYDPLVFSARFVEPDPPFNSFFNSRPNIPNWNIIFAFVTYEFMGAPPKGQ